MYLIYIMSGLRPCMAHSPNGEYELFLSDTDTGLHDIYPHYFIVTEYSSNYHKINPWKMQNSSGNYHGVSWKLNLLQAR